MLKISETDWKWAEEALLFRSIRPKTAANAAKEGKKMEQNNEINTASLDESDLPWTNDVVIDELDKPRNGESEIIIQTNEDVGPADESLPN